ncbi:phosphotransferase enzyme family-domain-containing protein [Immersiella caudata]|uniref:Phosphotransferase enzyme family-domain-containing protein n=1 Tax=Immersiella caudata TaxID=314043 RepID=A0AA39WSM4_9PEZI|nr:phosphotransferase enzyme family-domain-containing protein [Immersiella caudata]
MRISLPVYPRHKTRAEVATLRWVRENTSIPVPKVFAFDDSNDNLIGFEWILMEHMKGTNADTRWRAMSMEQKVALTERMTKFQAELSRFGRAESLFRGIGTLDLCDESNNVEDTKAAAPGFLVSPEFFIGDHVRYDISRGPFRSAHDWLSTVLKIILQHQTAILKTSEDEDNIEDAENVSAVAQKLLALVPKVFPSTLEEPEATALYHHDLHLNNILVSEDGEITAVLDWECVSAMPLWMSAKLPKFLEGPAREKEPQRDSYADTDPVANEPAAAEGGGELGGQEKNELYYIHRMEYEATQLRKVYKAKLKQLWPEWPLDENPAEMDLFEAISMCDGIWAGRVGRWADRMEKGETMRFDMEDDYTPS